MSSQDSNNTTTEIETLRNEKTIYVMYGGSTPNTGQSVEIILKDPKDSLSDSINKKFLKGYNPEECYPQIQSEENGIFTAIIGYPEYTGDDAPSWLNAENCPQDYTSTNGISYFYYDESVPDRFAYFSIGQYAIYGSADYSGWQDTFRFLSK
jgi:hypothetical protein